MQFLCNQHSLRLFVYLVDLFLHKDGHPHVHVHKHDHRSLLICCRCAVGFSCCIQYGFCRIKQMLKMSTWFCFMPCSNATLCLFYFEFSLKLYLLFTNKRFYGLIKVNATIERLNRVRVCICVCVWVGVFFF